MRYTDLFLSMNGSPGFDFGALTNALDWYKKQLSAKLASGGLKNLTLLPLYHPAVDNFGDNLLSRVPTPAPLTKEAIKKGTDKLGKIFNSNTATGGFMNSKVGKFGSSYGGAIGDTASAIGDMIGKRGLDGKYGGITKGMDAAYDTIQKAASSFGPVGNIVSGAMGVGKLVGNAVSKIGGGTDGMTKTDAILNSAFLNLTPLGLINGFGGKKADTYTRNVELDKSTDGGFQGFLTTQDLTQLGAGKKYGLFSSGARNKQNQLTEFTLNMKHTVSGIVDTNTINNLAAQGSTPFLAQQQLVDLSGGIQQMRAARQGMQFSRRVVSKYAIGNKLRRSIKVLDVATNKYVEIPLNLDKDQIKGRKPIRLYNGTAVFMNGDGTVSSDHWESGERKEHLTPKGKNGTEIKRKPREMNVLISYANGANPPFILRINNNDTRSIKLADGTYATHLLGYGEADGKFYVYPNVLEVNGNLMLIEDEDPLFRALKNKDVLEMLSEDEAKLFTEEYKKYYPKFFLQFKKGGHLTLKGEKGLKAKHWLKPSNWSEEKIPYNEWIKDINPEYLNPNYDLELAYKYLPKELLERWKFGVNSNNPKYYSEYKDSNGDYIYHLGSVVQIPNSEDYIFLKKGTEKDNPELHFETDMYHNGENGLKSTHSLSYEGDRYYYRRKPNFRSGEFILNGNIVSGFKKGGQMNVIPEGALHARLNHLDLVDPELAKNTTKKGIPVITLEDGGEIIQHAEIEHSEIIFTLEVTNKLEKLRKDGSDKAAIEAGKLLVQEILHNTDDRTNLIAQI